MTAAKRITLISIDDYLAGELVSDVRHEYLAGRVYAMAGGKTVHNRVAIAFLGAMHAQLRGKRCEPFNSDMKVRVRHPAHTSFYYPDGMVVCEPNPPDALFQDRPVVIAEVISESTRRIDEEEKRAAYCMISTLTAYLLIETAEARVVVYRRAENHGVFLPEVYEGLAAVIPLPGIGAELRLADLYTRVDFSTAEPESDDEAAGDGPTD
jgi:Uma2 family endonuclease